jgi:peptidoglycan/xylan/chitin deacetylase (PgdA/CDA1 family)
MNPVQALLDRRAGYHSDRRALILLYHRVAKTSIDPWRMSVTPRHFGEQLDVLRRLGNLLRVDQLVRTLSDGELPERCIVVTFDDGYADNLVHAKPLLERFDVPATAFLSTGYVGQEREFWWDELSHLLLQPGTLPQSLSLSVNGKAYRWDLGEAAQYDEAAHHLHRKWRAWDEAPTSRHALYASLWELLRSLPERERQRALDELHDWAGTKSDCRPSHRTLSLEESVTLAHGGLIEIGAHTITHSALSMLSAESQRAELHGSRETLENLLNRRVTSFSYPFGRHSDYTPETVTLVREAGFASACSNFPGAVGPSTSHFQLPRLHVLDWDGEKFARWLSEWFHRGAQ